jgi:hypothetical protein
MSSASATQTELKADSSANGDEREVEPVIEKPLNTVEFLKNRTPFAGYDSLVLQLTTAIKARLSNSSLHERFGASSQNCILVAGPSHSGRRFLIKYWRLTQPCGRRHCKGSSFLLPSC